MGRPKSTSPTARQAECVATYRRLAKAKGLPPTNVEIAEAMGIDEAAVRRLLASAGEHGLCTRVADGPRGILLTIAGELLGAKEPTP